MTQKQLNAMTTADLIDHWAWVSTMLGQLKDPRPKPVRAVQYGPASPPENADAYVAVWVERAMSPYLKLMRQLFRDGAPLDVVEAQIGVRMRCYADWWPTARNRFQRDTQIEYTTPKAFGQAVLLAALFAVEDARRDQPPTLPDSHEPQGLADARIQRYRRQYEKAVAA